jgi:hypothetical protein
MLKRAVSICFPLVIVFGAISCTSPSGPVRPAKIASPASSYTSVENAHPEYINLFTTRRPRERVFPSHIAFINATWNWEADQLYTLHTTGGEQFTVRLPYFSATSPVKLQLSVNDVKKDDGWLLLYANFGSAQEGTEVPRFFLYNKFQGILRFFFFNYKIDSPFSSALVRLRLINTGAGTSTPPLLTYYAGDPELWKPVPPRPDGYQGEYLDNYDRGREVMAVTQLAFREWCYADFFLIGYDPQLGSNTAYTDSAFAFEVVGVDESKLQVDGQLSIAPLYSGGTSNILSDLGSLINQIPVGAIVKVISAFASKEEANKADQEKAERKGKITAKNHLLSLANAVLTEYLPGVGKVAGFLGKLIGGTSSKKLVELKGSVSLTGTLTRSSIALYTYLRLPGVQHTGQDAMPFNVEIGIINLATQPRLRAVDFTYQCRPDPFDPRVEVCDEKFFYRGDPIDFRLNDTITGAKVRAEAAITDLKTGITVTPFVDIGSFQTLQVQEMVGALTGISEINLRWYAVAVRVIVEPELAGSVPVYIYGTYVPIYST